MRTEKQYKSAIHLIGMKMLKPTTNADQQSAKDIGAFWQAVHQSQFWNQLPEKINTDLIAVYYDYQGGHEDPFRYFVGVAVPAIEGLPEGLDHLTIPAGNYQCFKAKGKMPECIGTAWQSIWEAAIERDFSFDYEIYGPSSYDMQNAEVPIYISVK